jgi:hypothetical protein
MPTHTIVTTDPLTPPRSLPCPRYLAGPALRLEICRRSTGQFTGERTMRTGRRALTRIRAIEPGEVIELDREQLFGLIQTDAELSDIFMRAFRVELIAGGYGDRDDWLDALRRNAARGGIPDAQWPPVSLHRPRSRRRCARPPRSVSCERRRRAGGDLPGRRRASESEQSADSRLPRLQRCESTAHASATW